MAAHSVSLDSAQQDIALNPVRIVAFPRLRALAWRNDALYACRGYTVLRATMSAHVSTAEWKLVGQYRTSAWRTITSSSRLASRLFRDGFHALVALPSGHLVAAVPHAIVTLTPGETEFRISHKVQRGTRPLHLAATPSDQI